MQNEGKESISRRVGKKNYTARMGSRAEQGMAGQGRAGQDRAGRGDRR